MIRKGILNTIVFSLKMKALWLLTFLCTSINQLSAQDIHFSQFYNAPQTLNPALTGNIDGNMRVILNHRSQWGSIDVPFVTSSFAFDSRLLGERWRVKGDALGAGIAVVNDKSGDGNLNNLEIRLGTAYHNMFGYEQAHSFSYGIQVGFFQRSIDYSKLVFGSQYFGEEFVPSSPSGENISDFSILRTDVQAGMVYQYIKPGKFNMDAGLSFFHLTRPNGSLLNQDYRVPMRTVFHWSSRIQVKDGVLLCPGVLFVNQRNARELEFGSNAEYLLKTEHNANIYVDMGLWYRLSDALVVTGGAEYQKWKVMLSYDINMSELRAATNRNGGFEIGVIYNNKVLPGKGKLSHVVPCLRL